MKLIYLIGFAVTTSQLHTAKKDVLNAIEPVEVSHPYQRVKASCGIPNSVSWAEVNKTPKYRQMVANKCKNLGIRIERKHR